MKDCPHSFFYWVKSHLLKTKVDSLKGSLWFRNPLGHFNLLKSFQIFTLPDELILSYLHSSLLGHWDWDVSLLLYQEIRYYARSDTIQSPIVQELSLKRGMKRKGWERQLRWHVWIQQHTKGDRSTFAKVICKVHGNFCFHFHASGGNLNCSAVPPNVDTIQQITMWRLGLNKLPEITCISPWNHLH